jgi:hypothetical protein
MTSYAPASAPPHWPTLRESVKSNTGSRCAPLVRMLHSGILTGCLPAGWHTPGVTLPQEKLAKEQK